MVKEWCSDLKNGSTSIVSKKDTRKAFQPNSYILCCYSITLTLPTADYMVRNISFRHPYCWEKPITLHMKLLAINSLENI